MFDRSATDTGKPKRPPMIGGLLTLVVFLASLTQMGASLSCAQSMYTFSAPTDDGTSTSLRVPSGLKEHAHHRTAILVGASELFLIPSGTKIESLGFVVVEGAGAKVTGTLKLYLANSASQAGNLEPSWGTLVSGMQKVYDGTFTIPDTAGTIACSLTESFIYLGNGLTFAYEFQSPGPFTTRNAVFAANTALRSSARTGFSETSAPEVLGDVSDFRPVMRIGFPFPPFQWVPLASGTRERLRSLDVVNDSTGWVCSSTQNVYLTTNRGATWHLAGELSVPTTGIVGLTNNTALVTTDSDSGSRGIFKTSDGGITWSQVYDAGPSMMKILDNLSANQIWGILDAPHDTIFILNSFNGGGSWMKMSNSLKVPSGMRVSRAAYCRIGSTLWFGTSATLGEGGRVYKSLFGPNGPWSFSSTRRKEVSALGFSSPSGAGLLAHAGCRDTIQRTTDGGLTWTDLVVAGLGEVMTIEYFPGGEDAWAATSTGIWHTSNDGIAWERSLSVYPDTISSLRFFGSYQAALAVGSNGVVVRGTWALNTVQSAITERGRPNEYILAQNFPNPFNSNTQIEFSIPESQFVSLKIVDLLGREIEVLTKDFRLAGTHTVVWNASRLTSGVYFYTLRVGPFQETKKLVLLR
ncbi:MAG: T9SS type A sorting domain-containing protein [Ignavibacteriales bacterium]|nr:T9SS type A sorting domain-containing protein [Ignavibacteriales bacterium]